MLKKTISLLLCLGVFLTSTGCSHFLEDEVHVSSVHVESDPPIFNDAVTSEVKSYKELKNEILRIVSACRTKGTIRFVGYDGDIERDVSDACIDVSHNTAVGAYAVFHINFSVNKIVSYYEADINVTYKKTQEQIRNIINLASMEDFLTVLEKLMDASGSYLAVMTRMEEINEERIRQAIEQVYYTRSVSTFCLPDVTIGVYPENGEEKVVDIAFTYPFSGVTLQNMQVELSDEVNRVARKYVEYSNGRALLNLCEYIASTVTRIAEVPEGGETAEEGAAWDSAPTAYGALVEKAANSEGFAMAFKLVCDVLGIECGVVIGKYNGEPHAWNVVSLNGDYYHIDPANCGTKGIANVFLKSDEEMLKEYWWDIEQVKPCRGSLSYYDIA